MCVYDSKFDMIILFYSSVFGSRPDDSFLGRDIKDYDCSKWFKNRSDYPKFKLKVTSNKSVSTQNQNFHKLDQPKEGILPIPW